MRIPKRESGYDIKNCWRVVDERRRYVTSEIRINWTNETNPDRLQMFISS